MTPNGRTSFFQWALGLALTLVLGMLTVNFRLVMQRLDVLEAQGSPALRERVATLERAMIEIRVGQDRLETQLERNNTKLDRVLDRLIVHAEQTK